MWPAEVMAQALATPYRASTYSDAAVDEALRLLRPDLSFAELKKQRAQHVRGPLTWAKLAEGVGRAVGEELLHVDEVDEIRHAAAHAARLRRRLAQRDASHGARVTLQTRELVIRVSEAAATLHQLASLTAESADALTLDDGGRTIALHGKLVKLRDEFGGSLSYPRRVLERAVSTVRASAAHGGVKSLYEKALERWPASAAGAAGAAPAADDGVVQWEDSF
jgi:hypothetical protein